MKDKKTNIEQVEDIYIITEEIGEDIVMTFQKEGHGSFTVTIEKELAEDMKHMYGIDSVGEAKEAMLEELLRPEYNQGKDDE